MKTQLKYTENKTIGIDVSAIEIDEYCRIVVIDDPTLLLLISGGVESSLNIVCNNGVCR